MKIYCVFNSDGYECSDLIGIFYSEDDAKSFAERIERGIRSYYEHEILSPWNGSVDVKPLDKGILSIPTDAQIAEENGWIQIP